MIAQAYEQQPVQQPQQPVQQQPQDLPRGRQMAYSQPEQTYKIGSDTIPRYTLDVDEETKEIIESISPELRNAFVVLSIKSLRNDPLYLNFFKIKSKEEIQEDINHPPEAQELTPQQGNSFGGPNNRSFDNGNNGNNGIPTQTPEQTQKINDAFSAW